MGTAVAMGRTRGTMEAGWRIEREPAAVAYRWMVIWVVSFLWSQSRMAQRMPGSRMVKKSRPGYYVVTGIARSDLVPGMAFW